MGRFRLEERSQGAIEYLLMLTAALIVVASITYLLFASIGSMGENIRGEMNDTLSDIIDRLTGSLAV